MTMASLWFGPLFYPESIIEKSSNSNDEKKSNTESNSKRLPTGSQTDAEMHQTNRPNTKSTKGITNVNICFLKGARFPPQRGSQNECAQGNRYPQNMQNVIKPIPKSMTSWCNISSRTRVSKILETKIPKWISKGVTNQKLMNKYRPQSFFVDRAGAHEPGETMAPKTTLISKYNCR